MILTAVPGSTPARSATPQVEERWNVYHPDPQHLWDRLFRQLYRRTAKDGQEYGRDTLDPLLWHDTTYLLEEPSYGQTIRLLDEFLATHGEELITDPLKRAMLQRDLWAVFDWAVFDWRLAHPSDNYPHQRQALQQRLARIIQRLALTPQEIQALPDNYEAAVKSGVFPASYQVENPAAVYLPADLFAPNGGWVCLGRAGGPLAMTHTETFPFFGRSAFLVFIRVPGGREATLNFLHQLNTKSFSGSLDDVEVALVRRMLLIDQDGGLTLSPLVESVQLRHFRFGQGQLAFEFDLNRNGLFAGKAAGLQPRDKEIMLFMSHGDAFRLDDDPHEAAIPAICLACHTGGVSSILSASRERFRLPDRSQPIPAETTPELEARAVIAWKLQHDTWRALQAAWR